MTNTEISARDLLSLTKAFGTIFVIVLLVVAIITSITIRGFGPYSFLCCSSWSRLSWPRAAGGDYFRKLGQLSIHINRRYLLIATVLLILWIVNLVFSIGKNTWFSRRAVRVRLEIGGEETVFDTTGMAVMKQRADLFRHWILGFGSGDLIIKPVGVVNPIEFPNVVRRAPKWRD